MHHGQPTEFPKRKIRISPFCGNNRGNYTIKMVMPLHPDDPASRQVKATLRKFQQTTSLKVTLPLTELEAAREDMEVFMRSCLQELSSQTGSREMIGELSQKLVLHMSRV